MGEWLASLRRLFGAAILAAGVGCSGDTPDAPADVDPASADVGAGGDVEADTPVASAVARILAVGPSGRSPREVSIRLGRELFPSDRVGRPVPEATEWRIEPKLAGELRVVDTDELAFIPTDAFVPGTTYEFQLSAVGPDSDNRVLPGEDDDWSHSFEVPAFGLVRASTSRHDPVKMQAVLDLVFSADVDPGQVASKATFRMGGAVVRPDAVERGPLADTVRLTFLGRAFASDGELSIQLAKGIPASRLEGVTAPAAKETVPLKVGEPVEMEAILVKEGSSGFYIDVVCTDPAAGGERWYWDPDTYDGWWVSQRCQPDPDLSRDRIHISPAVDFTVATAPGGFRLFGDFQPGRYDITLDAGLRTMDGGVLRDAWERKVRVPDRTARINFTTTGRYLPRSAWRDLPVQHVNVNMVDLTVRHVPPENLVFWMSGEERAGVRTSNVIYKTEVWLQGKKNALASSWLDMRDMLPDVGRGVYQIEVHEKDGRARDSVRILLTDMLLVAKLAEPAPGETASPEAMVWVRDIHKGSGVSGAEISLVRKSGKAVARCRTDGEGGCRLEMPADEVDTAAPFAIIARKGDDLTYLRFSDLQITPDTDVGGQAWKLGKDDAAYRAAVYTDRGVYRPGDTAHVSAVLRGADHLAPPPGLRVEYELKDPSYNAVRTQVVETDANGLVNVDLPFHDFARTGRWTVSLSVAGRKVGTASINVEEFVPERMKVTGESPEQRYLSSDPVPVDVEARWLFGGSAKGSRVEMTCALRAATIEMPGHEGYHFGLAAIDEDAVPTITLGMVDGELDDDGRSTLRCPAGDDTAGRLGAAEVIADVSVFEGQSGRTTDTRVRTQVHPTGHYIGSRASTDKAESGVPVRIDGRIVSPEGRQLKDGGLKEVSLQVVRLDEEYGWWWDEEDGSSAYRRLLRRSPVEQLTIAVKDGAFAHTWTPQADAAGYLLVFEGEGARTEHHLDGAGRRYLWSPRDSSVDQTPRARRPTPLRVQLPDEARVGETITAKVEAPYSGRLLWTVETDRVLRHAWVDVVPGETEWAFPIESFEPNVYVTAFLIKDPHLESAEAYIPDRAFGARSLPVVPEDHVRDVKLIVPDEVRPYSTLEVTLDLGPLDAPATATIAAVDEGILQLTRFESPDPAKQLFAQRRLGVDSYETVGWTMLMEPRGPSSSTGGDGVAASGRVQMVKPVALWSGVVEVPKSGKVTVPMEVPGYRGQLRVMAVVADKQRVGRADAEVKVRDPLVLTTTLPRFLSRGDVAQIPVMVTNMSGKHRNVRVRLRAEAFDPFEGRIPGPGVPEHPITFVGDDRGSIELAEGEGGTVVFRVRADHAPAAVRFEVQAEADGLLSVEKLELPVVADTPVERRILRQELAAGTLDVDQMLSSQGWYPGADTTTLWVTTNPYATAMSHLSHVVRYPYGCVEQTSSSTRPLLYVRGLLESVDPSLLQRGSIDEMVKAGVDRLMSMQTPSGGFAYWPGGHRPSEWGTAYALHLLIDAREAGFDVPAEPVADALEWLHEEVGDLSSDSVNSTVAYQHYVLAKAGKGRPADAAAMLEALPARRKGSKGLSRRRWDEAEFLLQAAMFAGGDRRHERALQAEANDLVATSRGLDHDYYSDRRSRAMRLDVLEDLFKGSTAGEALADRVASDLSGHPSRWYTTQELAWGISALGKRTAGLSNTSLDATLEVGGTALARTDGRKKGDISWTLRGATGLDDVELEVEGAGARQWLVTTVEGARAVDDLPVGGDGLKISRTWLTAKGEPVDWSSHALGDRLFVRVDVTNTSKRRVSNVAVVDRLPAGWEIENPRLGSDLRPDWARSIRTWGAEHMNVRDDRIELFGTISGQRTITVLYSVRAVTAGTFQLPDVTAEAMYDPDVWARQPGKEVSILGPWSAFFL